MDGYREEGSSSQDRQSIPIVHEVGEGSSQTEEGFPHAAFSITGTVSPGTMFRGMQGMVPNPMYANIGMQPRFWGTQGQFGVSQGNLGMAGFSIPSVKMTPRHQHVTGLGVQMAPIGSLVKLSQHEAAKRLEGFLSRLDSILPYLALAVNAVSLLRTSYLELSPSRLMEASHLIRCAEGKDGLIMSMTSKLHKFETRLTLPRWQEKMLLCHASLRKSANREGSKADEIELFFIDGNSSEESNLPLLRFSLDNIVAIGSSTLHVLGLGEHNLEGVLLLDLVYPLRQLLKLSEVSIVKNILWLGTYLKDGCNISFFFWICRWYSESLILPVLSFGCMSLWFSRYMLLLSLSVTCKDLFLRMAASVLQESSQKLSHYALQCIEDNEGDTDGSSEEDENARDKVLGGLATVGSTSRISKLSLLEYVLRLCMLQTREEKNHWDISDERINMFFSDPRYVSEPISNVQKPSGGSATDIAKLTPTQKKKSFSDPSIQTPPTGSAQQQSRRLSITEMFYDLQVDSPAKLGRDVT
ncbi:hypothetical protein L7F22_064480 [Adiantum nelumboides]|nr:hypothetical protein [Adiantum nelumboides]